MVKSASTEGTKTGTLGTLRCESCHKLGPPPLELIHTTVKIETPLSILQA